MSLVSLLLVLDEDFAGITAQRLNEVYANLSATSVITHDAAVDSLRRGAFNAVFYDIGMDKDNHYSRCAELKENNPDIRLIAMSIGTKFYIHRELEKTPIFQDTIDFKSVQDAAFGQGDWTFKEVLRKQGIILENK